jgi:hypothetical protein
LLPLVSIVGVIFGIRYVSDTATWLTYLALIAVPPLAAVALGWAMRGSTPLAALGAVPLFAIAWAAKDSLAGEAAGSILSALSCVTLGVLLAAVTPPGWLKVGILLMAGADVWLVASDLLQNPNSTLTAAQPAAGLPQLQSGAPCSSPERCSRSALPPSSTCCSWSFQSCPRPSRSHLR